MAENELMKATQNWLDMWLNDLKMHGAFEKTIETYHRGLLRFLRWLAEQGITEPTAQDIAHYRDDLKSRYAAKTVNLSLSAVRSFYKFLVKNGAITHSPAADVEGIKMPKNGHKRGYLSNDEVLAVFDTCDQSPIGIRDRAILMLMAYCALREIEIQRANVSDLRANGRLLLWVQGKGHTEPDEYVVIPREQERVMRAWLAERAKVSTDSDALFISLSKRNRGERLSTRAIRNMVNERFELAVS